MAGNSGGGKGPGKVATPEATNQLLTAATKIVKGTNPVRTELLSQMLEALKTGGVGAQIPLIQRSVEASKQATSNAMVGTTEGLAQSNLVGTPFGQRILAQQRQAGAQQASQIPTQIAGQIAGGAPAFVAAMQGQGLSALTNAGAQQYAVDANNAAGWRAFMQDLKQSIMAATTKGAGGGGGGEGTLSGLGGGGVNGTGYTSNQIADQAYAVDNPGAGRYSWMER